METPARRERPTVHRTASLYGLLVLLALAVSACTFEVQPIEEYASADGYLSFTFPAAWDVLEEDTSDGMTTALVGTHEDLLNMPIIPPGQAGLGIMLMPDFIVGPDGEAVTMTAEELAGFMRDSALAEQGIVGEVETVTLADGSAAYTFAAPSPEADMSIYVFAPAHQILAVAALIVASGENNSALVDAASGIVNSVKFNGDPAEFGARAREIISSMD